MPAITAGVAANPSIDQVCSRVASILKRERMSQQLSLTRVAEKAALSRQMVSYVERGLRIPTIDTLLRITRVLGIDAADVITRAHRGR